ncbi:MAG: hypothetical protein IKH24_00110 [Bacteroidales bacterium]|nr:hypothetical protein [Bacteroidales bacterium]
MRKSLSVCLLSLLVPMLAVAQVPLLGGQLTGGLESDFALYRDGGYGSNNYLKLDYVQGRFSAGVQVEWYPTPMLGYDPGLKGFGVPGKYIALTEELFSLTLGDFYEQFGMGLILRSWEDRNLGWNNSIGGARATFRTRSDSFSFKVLYGFPRKYLWYSDTQVAGAGATVRLGGFSLEGSVADYITDGRHGIRWSLMPAWSKGGFAVKAEYARRPGGNAQLVEMNYASRGFSSSLTLRRLDGMGDPLGMDYLPALCQEQTYMLASLNPYTTFTAGEIGGAADVFYRYKTWRFHVNGSMIYALPNALRNYDVYRMCYRDINIDVETRWSSRFKTVAFVSIQEQSPSRGDRLATDAQNVFVLDGLYRWSGKYSLRAQVQYLYSQELTRDWMAALLEFGLAPHWNLHVSDMYNHGDTKEHYYEAGVSYSRSAFKLAVSYGHQRAGYICSGGVCRWQPEYTGGMVRLNYAF